MRNLILRSAMKRVDTSSSALPVLAPGERLRSTREIIISLSLTNLRSLFSLKDGLLRKNCFYFIISIDLD
jgi:hypothetical protein